MFNKLRTTVKETAIYSIGNIASKLAGFILIPLFSETINISLYGLLTLFEICFDILTPISNLGIENALMRWFYDKETEGKRKSLYFTVFAFSVVFTLLIVFLSYIVMINYSEIIFSTQVDKSLIFIFLFSVLIRLIVASPQTLLRIQQKAVKQTASVVLGLILTVLFTYIFLKFYKMELYGVFLAQVVSNLVLLILFIPTIFRNIQFKVEVELLKKMIHYSYPLVFSGLLTTVLVLSDRYILNYYYTLGDVGVYSLAYKISNIVKICITTSFMQSYVISYYRGMNEISESNRFLVKSLTYFVFVACYLSLFIVYFGKEVLVVLSLGNKDYWQAYLLLPLLLISVTLAGVRQISSMPLRRDKQTKLLSVYSILAAVLNVLLNFVFIPKWGAYGAVISTVITQCLIVFLYDLYIRKKFKILVEYRRLLIVSVVSILIFIPLLFLNEVNLLIRIPIKLIILISFPFVLYILKFYSKDELNRVRGAWDKWSNLSQLKNNIKKIKR